MAEWFIATVFKTVKLPSRSFVGSNPTLSAIVDYIKKLISRLGNIYCIVKGLTILSKNRLNVNARFCVLLYKRVVNFFNKFCSTSFNFGLLQVCKLAKLCITCMTIL